MPLRIYDLNIDEHNEAKARAHGVTEAELRQVLDNQPVFLPNKKGHSAPVIMIGPTFGGRFITVPLSPTAIDGLWRPSTAWPSSEAEHARYTAARGAQRAH
jgi:hypothetical protein